MRAAAVLAALLVAGGLAWPDAANDLVLSLVMDKESYALGETLRCTVKLTNGGGRVRRLRELRFDPRSVHFLVEWPGGSSRVGRIHADAARPLDLEGIALAPGESVEALFEFPAVVAGELEMTAKYNGILQDPVIYVDSISSATVKVPVTGAGELQALMTTSAGEVRLRFHPEEAFGTVTNFVALAGAGFYDGLIFHRVIKGFMIQGGCPLGDGSGGPGWWLPAEFGERKHVSGTLAMARASDPNSAGSQFYICLEPEPGLDGKYTVFGQVVSGQEVVQAIGELPTERDRPKETVTIEKIEIVEVKP